MEKLAPGVIKNVLFHGAMVALAPVLAFFMLNWLGFSDVWCAIGKLKLCKGFFLVVPILKSSPLVVIPSFSLKNVPFSYQLY